MSMSFDWCYASDVGARRLSCGKFGFRLAAAEAVVLTGPTGRRSFCDAGINTLRFNLRHHYGWCAEF